MCLQGNWTRRFPQINCGDASQYIEATSKSYYQTAKAEFDSFSQCDTSWQLKPQSGVPIKCIVLRNSWTFDVKNAADCDFSSRLCASPCFCSTFQGKETGLVIPLQAVPEIQAFPTASPFKRCAREVSNAKTTYECYKSRAAQNFGTQSISSLSPSNRRQISSVSRWQVPDDTPTDLIHGARRNTVSDRTIYQDDSTQDVFRTGPPSQQVSAQPSKAAVITQNYCAVLHARYEILLLFDLYLTIVYSMESFDCRTHLYFAFIFQQKVWLIIFLLYVSPHHQYATEIEKEQFGNGMNAWDDPLDAQKDPYNLKKVYKDLVNQMNLLVNHVDFLANNRAQGQNGVHRVSESHGPPNDSQSEVPSIQPVSLLCNVILQGPLARAWSYVFSIGCLKEFY